MQRRLDLLKCNSSARGKVYGFIMITNLSDPPSSWFEWWPVALRLIMYSISALFKRKVYLIWHGRTRSTYNPIRVGLVLDSAWRIYCVHCFSTFVGCN